MSRKKRLANQLSNSKHKGSKLYISGTTTGRFQSLVPNQANKPKINQLAVDIGAVAHQPTSASQLLADYRSERLIDAVSAEINRMMGHAQEV